MKLIGFNGLAIVNGASFNNDSTNIILVGLGTIGTGGDKTLPLICTDTWGTSDDYWIVKTDLNRNVIRDWSFAGLCSNNGNSHRAYSVTATSDGGFLVAGNANSEVGNTRTDPKHSNGNSDSDIWLVKVDAAGNKQWDKTIGTQRSDQIATNCVHQLADGGYIIGAYTNELNLNFDKSCQNNWVSANTDAWLVRTDANGNKIWDKCFGEEGNDFINSVLPLPDGGFLLLCTSNTNDINGTKSEPSRGVFDGWVIRTDANGNKIWDKTFGGPANDDIYSAIPLTDGGFILVGRSATGAGGDKSQPGLGGLDGWILKIDAGGNKLWDMVRGTSSDDGFRVGALTNDGGLMLAGYSAGGVELDKSQPSRGGPRDNWVLKLKPDPLAFEQLYLIAKSQLKRVTLKWTDANYKNDLLYKVLRLKSQNLFVWDTLGYTSKTFYSDTSPKSGHNFYQICRVETDGSCLLSNIAQANVSLTEEVNVYPNPAQDFIIVDYRLKPTETSHIEIYNTQGAKVFHTPILDSVGNITVNTSEWAEGIYFCRVISSSQILFETKIQIYKE